MLQAIVCDDEVNALGNEPLPGGNPIRMDTDEGSGLTAEQERLIADLPRIVSRSHEAWLTGYPPAITPTDDARGIARCTTEFDEPPGYRRLPGATDSEIADHDHGHREPLHPEPAGPIGTSPKPHRETKQPGQWQEKPGQR